MEVGIIPKQNQEVKKVILYIPFMKFNPLHNMKDQGGIANSFNNIGWRTTLIIGDAMGPLNGLNCDIYFTHNKNVNSFYGHLSEAIQFIKVFKKIKPELVLVWNISLMPSLVGFFLKFYSSLCKYQTITTILRLDWDGIRENESKLRNFIFYANLKVANLLFDFETTETTCGFNRITRVLPKPSKLRVVPVGIDRLPASFEESLFKKEKVLLSIARIARYKNIDGIIGIFAKIADRYPDWHLNLIGLIEDKEYFNEIKALVDTKGISDRVHFLGELKYSEVDQWRLKSPIFLTLSYKESFNLARYEAMAYGMAVISSPAGCSEDFKGITVVRNEEEALNSICAAIEKFESTSTKLIYNNISINTWDDIAKMFIELLRSINPLED